MLNATQLSRVDLNLLVLLHVVLEEGHVARAAARLHLTPSAVSHGLVRLRRLFNDPLFLRTPGGVVPTERAVALRARVAEVLALAEGTLAAGLPFDPATSRRRFLLGAPDAVLASIAPALLDRIGAEAPGVDIGLIHLLPARREAARDGPWAVSLKQLEQREIDVALLPVQALPARYRATPLYDESFVVTMRRDHAFARKPTLAAFCAARHVLVSISGDAQGFVDDALRRRGRSRHVALTVPSFMMALDQLARSPDLLAALPRRLVERHAARFDLAWVELPFKRKPDTICAVATRAAAKDAGVAWLLAVLAAACGAPARASS